MDELKIIKYLDGEMTGEESSAFEEEIRMNPPLAEEVENFRRIQDHAMKLLAEDDTGEEGVSRPDAGVEKEISEAVRDFKKNPGSFNKVSQEYRKELERADKRYRDQVQMIEPARMIRRIWYRAAAVIVLLLAVSVFLFRPFGRMSPDEVYDKYFNSFHRTGQVIEMARNDNDFLFAVEVYEAADFDRAAVLFEMLADSSVLRSWSLFYAGSSYMSLHQSGKAIALFQEVLTDGDAVVMPHARWQLALSYILTGEPALAGEQLEILSRDPIYRKDAKRIIRILY